MKKIVLIGPTPPPTGGVSIHIKRFGFLLRESGMVYRVISTTSSTLSDDTVGVGNSLILGLLKNLPTVRGTIVIVHSSELSGTFVALLCKIFCDEVIQFFHNGRAIKRLGQRGLLSSLWGCALRRLDGVFVVNSEIQRDMEAFSKKRGLVHKVNPYLPPHPSELCLGSLDELLCPGRIYIGWCGIATGDRADIYGFGFFLDLLIAVSSKLPNVFGVIGAGGGIDHESLSNDVKAKFNFISSRLIHVPEDFSFAAAMTRLHVFVRPTSSDGDAVSVREGLSLGAHVLASDVVERPQGVVLYKFGDVHDGLLKLMDLINKPRPQYDGEYSIGAAAVRGAGALRSVDEVRALIESTQS